MECHPTGEVGAMVLGPRVRVSTERWRVSGFMASRVSPAQENCERVRLDHRLATGCRSSCKAWPDSEAPGTGCRVSLEKGRRGDRKEMPDAGVWEPRGSGSQLIPQF